MPANSVEGNIVDVITGEIFPGRLELSGDVISAIRPTRAASNSYLIPGLIDAHIHIESSHLCPSRFAEAIVPHGTTAVVSDPHEIANVFGLDGIRFMIADSKMVPLRCYFTAPSCVPATSFERSGAILSHHEVAEMLSWPEIVALGEMMNFPGAVSGDEEVLRKLSAANSVAKPIDGHAPLLSGPALRKYVERGITTDHECTSSAEALEKHELGMTIQVRQGTACKNLPSLLEFAKRHKFMLVSDDRSAHDLLMGHLDHTLREAVSLGIDPLHALRAATLVPAEHYGLPGGWFEEGRAADIVVVDDLNNFRVRETWIAGEKVASEGAISFSAEPENIEMNLPMISKRPADFSLYSPEGNYAKIRTIVALRDEIVTEKAEVWLRVDNGEILPDAESDVLRIAIVNRYEDAPVSNGFIRGFGLKGGAIASTVAHDSHNCVVIGSDRNQMAEAVNACLAKGGFCISDREGLHLLELPIAGLMSDRPVAYVADQMDELLARTDELSCSLPNPFMTLSFMSLLVIPRLKIGDRGLFDVDEFDFVNPIAEISEEEPR